MHQHITIILRNPERIRHALEAARALSGRGRTPNVVFLCPGCVSGRDCRSRRYASDGRLMQCVTDRCGDCIPRGFRCVDAARIARLIRESDIVVPL